MLFFKFDGFVKSRHSGENRPPQADRELITIGKDWIPAFAGMTEKRIYRLFTRSSNLGRPYYISIHNLELHHAGV